MTGKLVHNDGEYFVLRKNKYRVSEFIIRKKLNNETWVEFDEFENDCCIVTKIYDTNFGTSLESVSDAYYRYEKNNYPVNGFNVGNKTTICPLCNNYYVGSEDSKNCEVCALEKEIKISNT